MSGLTRREFHQRLILGAVTGLVTQAISPIARADDLPVITTVDPSTMIGKVMAGYQGWFRTPDDGSQLGWVHWGNHGKFEPGECTIDFWPDVSELDADEKHATAFRHRDGSTAYVYSAMNRKTVVRHFKWMQQYGLDGVYVQRFASGWMQDGASARLRRDSNDTVLSHCRNGANLLGRAYAVMYDLTGMKAGSLHTVIDDWKHLVDDMRLTRDADDKAYLHQAGKPVVAIWGIGFTGDKRPYSAEECKSLCAFFKNDARYGGVTLMLGIPSYWRTMKHDARPDPAYHDVYRMADVLSPWTVGRYRDSAGVKRHAEQNWAPDLQWCDTHHLRYMPVVFPGTSDVNLQHRPADQYIPRRGGQFLWAQYAALKKLGVQCVYQAMFDEVDEGTQIFKVTNDPPTGDTMFRTYEGLSPDYYLRLVGQARRMMVGQAAYRSNPPPYPGFEALQAKLMSGA